MNKIKNIAIIGSGISGLTAAHILYKNYNITIFEANSYVGGHTNTVTVNKNSKEYAIDTGFIVFNEHTYPNFIRLLEKLDIATQKSNMSFSFSSRKNNLEYSGDTLNSLFCERKNFLNRKFYRLLFDIYNFNNRARKFIRHNNNQITIDDFLSKANYGNYFRNCYFDPLASAIWSMPSGKVGDIPAHFLLDFYNNHGLLNLVNRPQWYVIKGGSQEYVKKLIQPFSKNIVLNTAVKSVKRTNTHITIMTENDSFNFDAVVLACHSDEAVSLLENPSEAEHNILTSLPYQTNTAILHTDTKALPRNRQAWASWNYVQNEREEATLTYYMNKLQTINSQHHYCVSINNRNIDNNKIIKSFNYSHPLNDLKSVSAKKDHYKINGKNRTFYVGAYWGNGFHEDGVVSSMKSLSSLGELL